MKSSQDSWFLKNLHFSLFQLFLVVKTSNRKVLFCVLGKCAGYDANSINLADFLSFLPYPPPQSVRPETQNSRYLLFIKYCTNFSSSYHQDYGAHNNENWIAHNCVKEKFLTDFVAFGIRIFSIHQVKIVPYNIQNIPLKMGKSSNPSCLWWRNGITYSLNRS